MADDVDGVGGEGGAPWPGEWLRGLMEVCVLRVIADGPTYGYAIATALERAGLGSPKGGTLYPLLGRCEQAGWVGTRWGPGDGGPGRKFYELTPTGRDHLETMAAVWEGFAAAVSTHLAPAGQQSMPVGKDTRVAAAVPAHLAPYRAVPARQRTAAANQEGA